MVINYLVLAIIIMDNQDQAIFFNKNAPTLLLIIDKTIRKIVCERDHTLIFKESSELFAFGNNYKGQIGLGYNIDINVPTLMMIYPNELRRCK